MGTPSCGTFIPTPHQKFLAEELQQRLRKVYLLDDTYSIRYVTGAYIWGKFHYGGTFKWGNDHGIVKKYFFGLFEKTTWPDELSYYFTPKHSVSPVEVAEFVQIKNHVAIWREELLQWELIEYYKED